MRMRGVFRFGSFFRALLASANKVPRAGASRRVGGGANRAAGQRVRRRDALQNSRVRRSAGPGIVHERRRGRLGEDAREVEAPTLRLERESRRASPIVRRVVVAGARREETFAQRSETRALEDARGVEDVPERVERGMHLGAASDVGGARAPEGRESRRRSEPVLETRGFDGIDGIHGILRVERKSRVRRRAARRRRAKKMRRRERRGLKSSANDADDAARARGSLGGSLGGYLDRVRGERVGGGGERGEF